MSYIYTQLQNTSSFRLSVYNSGRVLQPAEDAFLADSALLPNAPANHTHEYHHRCLYSHVSKNVVQLSDICFQTQASPHCSHHCSMCYSVLWNKYTSLGQMEHTCIHRLLINATCTISIATISGLP